MNDDFIKSKWTTTGHRTRDWCRLCFLIDLERFIENIFRPPARSRCYWPGYHCIRSLFPFAARAAQSTDLTGIAHIALRVNDLDKSRDFYHKLGFEQGFEFSDNGKISVAYLKVNDRQFIELIPRTSDSQPGGILHTCFEVADIESLHKAYLDTGTATD